jgi:hypothetical protein
VRGQSEGIEADAAGEQCGWTIASLLSVDAPCWQIESLDVQVVRLRADGREHDCWGELDGCDIFACERVAGLEARQVVQLWAAPGIDGDTAAGLVVTAACE